MLRRYVQRFDSSCSRIRASAGADLSVISELRAVATRAPARARGPMAIVDIGSNSVRLVIYEGESRTAATVQNEKSICGIGRDMVSTGRLHAEGCAEALEALARFRLIADGPLAAHVSPQLQSWLDAPKRGELSADLRIGMETLSLFHAWWGRYRGRLREVDAEELRNV